MQAQIERDFRSNERNQHHYGAAQPFDQHGTEDYRHMEHDDPSVGSEHDRVRTGSLVLTAGDEIGEERQQVTHRNTGDSDPQW